MSVIFMCADFNASSIDLIIDDCAAVDHFADKVGERAMVLMLLIQLKAILVLDDVTSGGILDCIDTDSIRHIYGIKGVLDHHRTMSILFQLLFFIVCIIHYQWFLGTENIWAPRRRHC